MMGQPGLRWGPDIRADDGRLNVCIVRARTVLDYLGIFWHVVRGRHRESPNVRYEVASRSVEIAAKHPLPGPGRRRDPRRHARSGSRSSPARLQVVVPARIG